MLTEAAELANRHSDRPKQLNVIKDVGELIAEATAAEEDFHATTRKLVEEVGGVYERGPLKTKSRIEEKMYADYGET